MTLNEFKQKIANTPLKGTFLRPEFDKFSFGGTTVEFPDAHAIIASLNYKCLNLPGKNQKIKVLGIMLNVYVDSHRCEQVTVDESNIQDIENVIANAITKAKSQCKHDYGRELSQTECHEKGITHFGNCYHIYECSKCKLIYSVDSSD